jgi:hypothetical protein
MPDPEIPDHFVIVGAQRCGTTYLSQLLDEHPEIEMARPLRPEPKFFLDDDKYRLGLDYYEAHFFSQPGTRVRGEKSTSYIESATAVQRIRSMLPNASILVMLRDPVQRAISNYRFSIQNGVEDLPMTEALRAAAGRREWDRARFSVSPFEYLARGRYADYLEGIVGSVEPELLHVLLFEELAGSATVIADLYERLHVDPSFEPSRLGMVINASSASDSVVSPELEFWLRDYFRAPNERLEELLGRRLPWTA